MPLKLLLVEDSAADLEVMLSAIRQVGNVDVVVKTDGQQALEYL